MKNIITSLAGICSLWVLTFSSVFAIYTPTTVLETKVATVGTILVNIIETKHAGNFDLLLQILQGFESKVAWNEQKEWILESLITHVSTAKNETMNTVSANSINVDPIENEASMSAKVFDLEGFNFWYSQNTITVTQWDTVTINLTSTEWYHDRVVDEFNAATDALQAGESAVSVTFVADKAWTFTYYCSIGSHRAMWMIGLLTVEPKASTMKKDEFSWTTLTNVAAGQTIRWIRFNGSEAGEASLEGNWWNTTLYGEFDYLPDAWSENFYEGRIVRKSPLSIVSTWPLTKEWEMYIDTFTSWSAGDLSDHRHYVLTLEPNDGDPAPAEHILEGDL